MIMRITKDRIPFLTHDFQRVLEVVDYTNPEISFDKVGETIKYIKDYQPPEAEKGAIPVIFLSNLFSALEKLSNGPSHDQLRKGFLSYEKQGQHINLEPIRELIRYYDSETHGGSNGVLYIRDCLRAASEMVLDYLTPENISEYKNAAETIHQWSYFFNEISS